MTHVPFIPPVIQPKPPTCPNCGHEYVRGTPSGWDFFLIAVLLGIGLLLFMVAVEFFEPGFTKLLDYVAAHSPWR